MFQAMGMHQGGTASALPRNPHLSVASAGPVMIKRRAVEEAETQQKVIEEKLRKLSMPPTGYEFKELIGKGAYGRVYKSLHRRTGDVVAVKVLETDAMDYENQGPNKDVGMEDALKEINVLQRLQQSRAINVNLFHEAFQVHSQLWIVSEYCPGGSITTLRRATGNKLEERHIIPIARELAKGLKSVHEAGIVHRDIKCSNVMISETGRVQIIDFGVAGVLLSNLEDDKRKTVIGTPHWMAPEMQKNAAEIAHGTEVDCWAYGITLYECAMGAPPNARTMPGRQLQSKIRQEPPPRLPDKDRFSEGLQALVASVLEPDPKKRPNMDKTCQHPYLADTEKRYPTSSLAELVQKFFLWEHSGGARASLFMEGGAAKPSLAPAGKNDEEEWNFSTTANFEKKQQKEIIRLSMMDPNAKLDPSQFADLLSHSPPAEDDESDDYPTVRSSGPDAARAPADVDKETRIARGARAMQGLFDESAEPYKYGYNASDLPLRSGEPSESLHRKEVSVGSNSGVPQIDLKDAPKPRPNRATMNWKWDENLANTAAAAMPAAPASLPPPRPELHHSATAPVGASRPMSETLDLDAMLGDDSDFTLTHSNTQWGTGASSHVTSSAPSVAGGDEPDDDGDDGMIDLDIGDTMKPGYYAMGANMMGAPPAMYHRPKESDSSLSMPSTAPTMILSARHFPTGTTVAAGSAFSPAMPMLRRDLQPSAKVFPWPDAIQPAALVNGASEAVLTEQFVVTMSNWIVGLESMTMKVDEMDLAVDNSLGPDPNRLRPPRGSRHTSVSSLGDFSGPGEDVGEHFEDDDESIGMREDDGDDEADVDGDGARRY